MELDDLKSQSGLSNKQWDKTIKGLRGHEVINVIKTDEHILVEIN